MPRLTKILSAGTLCTAICVSSISAQDMAEPVAMRPVEASTLTWTDPAIPGFEPGMLLAVVHGDPSAKGPYTIRLKFPAGYTFPPHWHPMAENVTVLSGRFLLGMGDTRDASKLREYGPGDYLFIPAKHPHFGGVQGATVIQLHGTGPFELKLSQPATD